MSRRWVGALLGAAGLACGGGPETEAVATRLIEVPTLGVQLDVPEAWELREVAEGRVALGPPVLSLRYRFELLIGPAVPDTAPVLSERRHTDQETDFLVIEGHAGSEGMAWPVEAWVPYARDEATMRAAIASMRPLEAPAPG